MFLPASSDRRVVHVSASLPILRPLRAEVLVVFAALRESDLYGSECTSQTLRSQFINSRSRLSPPAALAWGHHKGRGAPSPLLLALAAPAGWPAASPPVLPGARPLARAGREAAAGGAEASARGPPRERPPRRAGGPEAAAGPRP
ncbi:unnamed protein product, partial [Prorocentrum cordatum]